MDHKVHVFAGLKKKNQTQHKKPKPKTRKNTQPKKPKHLASFSFIACLPCTNHISAT